MSLDLYRQWAVGREETPPEFLCINWNTHIVNTEGARCHHADTRLRTCMQIELVFKSNEGRVHGREDYRQRACRREEQLDLSRALDLNHNPVHCIHLLTVVTVSTSSDLFEVVMHFSS